MNEWLSHLLVLFGTLATTIGALYGIYGKVKIGGQKHAEAVIERQTVIIDRLNEENAERKAVNERIQQNLEDTLKHLNTLQISLIRGAQAQVGLSEKNAETQLELEKVRAAEEKCQERVRHLEEKMDLKIAATESRVETNAARIERIEQKVSNGQG